MSKITALRTGKGQRKRVNIFLDGRFAFSVGAEVAAMERLQVEQELSANQAEALARTDHLHHCLEAATRYLSYRPRSEAELREKLHRRGFDGNYVETVIARLKEQGLINDMAFAQFWRDNRQAFSPRSRWLTRVELERNGVASDIIDQVVNTINENDSAYRAAQGKAHRLSASDDQSFRRRLGGYLRRRGFDYGVINDAVERLRKEQGERPR